MSHLIYQGIVEDIRSDKCSDSEIEQLLEVFTRAIGYFTIDLSEKYWENLNDFFDSDKSEISNFSLKIQKKPKAQFFNISVNLNQMPKI